MALRVFVGEDVLERVFVFVGDGVDRRACVDERVAVRVRDSDVVDVRERDWDDCGDLKTEFDGVDDADVDGVEDVDWELLVVRVLVLVRVT